MAGRRPLLTLVLLGPAASGLYGQAAVVRGPVLSPDSMPVAGAAVRLHRAAESTRTSASGEFVFRGLAPDPDTLQIRMLGFPMVQPLILISPDQGWEGTIVLDPPVAELPEIRVTTAVEKPTGYAHTSEYDDFFRRRRLGFGTFRTRQDIEQKGAFDLVSVLQGIPGVSISSTPNPHGETEVRLTLARCRLPRLALYVDGRRIALFLNSPFEPKGTRSVCEDCVRLHQVLSSILIREIEFLEFYRGPGQIPSDLDRGDNCAVLAIWTR